MQPNFKQFKGKTVKEPSGITQIDDEHFLVVNDEQKDRSFSILTWKAAKQSFTASVPPAGAGWKDLQKLEDLEGVVKKKGAFYAITSYSGRYEKMRRRLVKLTIDQKYQVTDWESAQGCKRLKGTIYDRILEKFNLRPTNVNFNIEGFALDASEEEFMIGLRSPVIAGHAVVVKTHKIDQAFGENAPPLEISSDVKTLDLKGGGIRAMAYVSSLSGYLLVSGKGTEDMKEFPCQRSKKQAKFLLWFWDGDQCLKEILCFPTRGEVQPEGITPVMEQGEIKTVLIVSDDGDRDAGRNGRYWRLSKNDYQELQEMCRCEK